MHLATQNLITSRLTNRTEDPTGIFHVLFRHEQFFDGRGLDVSMGAKPRYGCVTFKLKLFRLKSWETLNQANKTLIVGISAVIIFIFLAVAFREFFRDAFETAVKELLGREKTPTVEEGLQQDITHVPRLEQQIEMSPRGSADEIAIRRLQEENESLKGRIATFRNPHHSGTLTPVQSRTERHGNSRRTG